VPLCDQPSTPGPCRRHRRCAARIGRSGAVITGPLAEPKAGLGLAQHALDPRHWSSVSPRSGSG
jgi:hypothetical protein